MSITINHQKQRCNDHGRKWTGATHFDSEDDYLTETLVTVQNSSFQDNAHPDDYAPKPFTVLPFFVL